MIINFTVLNIIQTRWQWRRCPRWDDRETEIYVNTEIQTRLILEKPQVFQSAPSWSSGLRCWFDGFSGVKPNHWTLHPVCVMLRWSMRSSAVCGLTWWMRTCLNCFSIWTVHFVLQVSVELKWMNWERWRSQSSINGPKQISVRSTWAGGRIKTCSVSLNEGRIRVGRFSVNQQDR